MEAEKKMILDVNESPKKIGQWLVLALQPVLAMFVACITVPLLVFSSYTVPAGFANAGDLVSYINVNGASLAQTLIAPTIVSAGIGTLIYIFFTKMKSPMFLASSFAYISPMCAALAMGAEPMMRNADGSLSAATAGATVVGAYGNLWSLPVGMAMVGAVYVIVALIIKFVGVKWLHKLLPSIVIGPVIMVIGLGLSASAVSHLVTSPGTSNAANHGYNLIALLCGLIAMTVTALCAHYGKKTVALIPFVLGMLAGYVAAAIFTAIGWYGFHNDYFHIVDWSAITDNFSQVSVRSFIDLPSFVFLPENFKAAAPLTGGQIVTIALLFIPTSLVTICEHIGDHENMSSILGRDLLEDPGLSRT